MNTKFYPKKLYIALILMYILMTGVAGCGSMNVASVSANAGSDENAIPGLEDLNDVDQETVQVTGVDFDDEPNSPIDDPEALEFPVSLPREEPTISDDEAIRAALAAHFGMDESEFTRFEVVENTGMHARGGVAANDGGGYFLAAKVDGQWIFVDGGQAAPNCNDVASYSFPASMVPECENLAGPSAGPDDDAIRAALAAHFEIDESEFTRFEIVENTGMHARGDVAAGGEGGGYFLAAKVGGQWIFVDGGHAAPNCNEVARYGFPAFMVPECPNGGSYAPDCPRLGTTVATFIEDVTYPDGTIVSPGSSFVKTWRIKNVGTCTWNSEYQLVFESGDAMDGPGSMQLTDIHIAPREILDISVELTAPDSPGTYRGNWKFRDPEGNIFGLTTGNPIWVEIEVGAPDSENKEAREPYSGYPTIEIIGVTKDQDVTIKGLNFPAGEKFVVLMNYNDTLGIGGRQVSSFDTGSGGSFTDTFAIPGFLKGQTIIAIRLESPTSSYYAYSWFFNYSTAVSHTAE